ncbi:MAG: hypothetical protein AMJ78_08600 [Omnitrophica WOR_2 bacterium SM23_29]|nr:MAG: hypothetical protein AMJ78_08600 [Omnitrophica WOR_2 bacterium SM23_29]
MYTFRRNRVSLKYIFIVIAICVIGFGCAKKPPSEEIAIKIDDYTLTAGEFNELFSELKISEDTPKTRKIFVENLINRKLLLQEAQREGLDKEKDFLKAIENFWEQSLLTIIVDKKVKEVSGDITVSEQEIQDSYNNWVKANPDEQKPFDEVRDVIRFQLLRQKQASALNSWIETLRKNANVKVNKKAVGIE